MIILKEEIPGRFQPNPQIIPRPKLHLIMKHLLFIFASLVMLIACNHKDGSVSTTEGTTTQDTTKKNPHQSANAEATGEINVGPPNGGITIAELINNKTKYSGQVVRVQGQVVKLNNGIMKRNWIHIKDASINSENKDLTVTTTESVALGDIVSFEGKIAVDKDFGSGYSYEIIMEEAKIIK